MNKKKDLFLSSFIVFVLLLFVVGISYAVWNKTFLGEKENSINTGYISFSYNESDTNTIKIQNAVPISDDNGKLLSGKDNVFDFNISAKFSGISSVAYEIYATPIEQTLNDKYVKVYLTNQNDQPVGDYSKKVPTFADLEDSSKTDSKTIYKSSLTKSGQSADYRLRIWVSEDFNEPEISKKLSFKVNVVGVA